MLPILLLDGGLGTTLGSPPHSITFTSSTPLWSSHLLLSAPPTLTAVHRSFLTAGTDILLTATYQTSFEGFTRTDPKFTCDDAARYMRSAIPLTRDAFAALPDKPARLALSLGPYGATMSPVAAEYSGLYPEEIDSENALRKWHGERLRVFVEDDAAWDGVKYVVFETVRRADEVKAIRGAVHDIPLGAKGRKPWWLCGVFPTEGVDEVHWDTVKKMKPGDWEGAILRGCCRAGPENIAALRQRVDQTASFDRASNVKAIDKQCIMARRTTRQHEH